VKCRKISAKAEVEQNLEISKKLADAINDQINFELYSGYIYFSMAAWFQAHNLPGMAHWMEVQIDEEYSHAIRFYRHVVERGGEVIVKPIQGPQTEFASPLEIFEIAYEHEKIVTQRIYKIGDIVDEERDRAAHPMLQWFYNEQVEEEKNTSEIRDMLKRAGDSSQALFMIDAQLATRPAAPPPPLSSTAPSSTAP
jgi:ferritin